MVSGATCFSRDDALETQLAKVEFIDENIDHPHRVAFVDVVFQSIREQKPLGTINAIHESLHAEHPSTDAQIMPVAARFFTQPRPEADAVKWW